MPFKINISHQGKTIKYEIESESLVDTKIGDKVSGKEISPDLEGYELEITGTSDKAGFPGIKELEGSNLQKILLTKGKFMHDKRKGVRLRKTVHGNQISLATVQINMKVIKEGKTKFEDLLKPKEGASVEEKPSEEKPEDKKPSETEKTEEPKKQEKPEEVKEESKKEESWTSGGQMGVGDFLNSN